MPKSEGNAFNMASAVNNNDGNDENSNCSSFTAGTSFTLWDESSARKGKTGKEQPGDLNVAKEPMLRTGQWTIEWSLESSSSHPNSLSSRSSSQPSAQHNQSFIQMLKSVKVPYAKEENEDEVFTLRKEGTSQRGELQMRVDGRASNDQKPNIPRSKHSATEQRRRCKINDRFLMLRELVPCTDQKRDKASFLLEAIEYIQFLQEKVSRYEGYPGWSSEPTKLTPWAMDQQTGLTNKTKSIPIPEMKADICPSSSNNSAVIQPASNLAASDTDNSSLQQLRLCQSRSCWPGFNSTTSNQEQGISSMYSQGLLNTLTQALKNSGVDVSQASISVQVEVGKRTNPAQSAKKSSKDFDINFNSHSLVHERVDTGHHEEFDHNAKKLKTLKS